MAKKVNKLWLIVWYDCDEEDDEGYITEDNLGNIPYRISCAYLDVSYSNWKYVSFPNRAGKISDWKRSEWMGKCFPLDYVFKDTIANLETVRLQGLKVEDLTDVTPYLIKGDIRDLEGDIRRKQEDLNKIKEFACTLT